jgi:uncharacterized membrane protein YeaQ/YmgE (transglycosylase-associated protein family)
MLGAALSILASGLLIGGLARWGVPGPDPMPLWLTFLFGIGGSVLGGGLAAAVVGTKDVSSSDYFTIILASIFAAMFLIILYRRFVQGRPITGPEAHKMPTKGIGIDRLRRRLRQFGVDPDSIGRPGGPTPPSDETQENLRKLEELHRAGLLTDEELIEKRRKLLEGSD